MGCGKSKHDVAAGNTISLSKRSNADEPKKIQKEADAAPEAAITAPEAASPDGEKEGESKVNTGSGGENVREVADVGVVTQETELKAEEEKDGETLPIDSSSTKEVDSSANVPLAEIVPPENVVEEKKEATDNVEPEVVKEENLVKELESAQTVDESKVTSAEGAAANAAASDGKTN